MDRELLQTYAKGLIATTGCPGGEVQTRLRLGQYDAARAAAAEFQDIFGKENYFAEIMDHGLCDRAADHDRSAEHREGSRHPARRHERSALHAPARRRAATRRCCACSRARRSTTRSASSSTATGTTSRRPPRCGRSSATTPRRATTRCSSPSAARSSSTRRRTTCRASRCPQGETEDSWFVKEVETGLHDRYPGGIPDAGAHAGGVRDRRHHADGLPRLLPRRRRLHQLGQAQRHPRRPRPRLGRRLDGRLRDGHHRPRPAAARPHLRAVPQPRPRLDARLRRRLRRPPPRRGHPVRHREVRRRARRADRHVRHDQGEAGAEGRRPRARLPVQHGGAAHQGDAARR